jgi:hypothetical protein
MVTRVDFKALSSISTSYSLNGFSTQQYKIVFYGGGGFSFNNLFKNCIDVTTRGFSLFYLTNERLLDANNNLPALDTSKEITTPIVFGSRYLVPTLTTDLNYDLNSTINLLFTQTPAIWEYFTIRFVNKKYCYIVYSDAIGDFYLAIDNSIGVLRRSVHFSSVFTTSGSQFFKYTLNSGRLALYKEDTSTGITQQVVINTETLQLSAIGITPASLQAYTFSVFNKTVTHEEDYNTDYVFYKQKNLEIDVNSSHFGIPQNYLISKNLNRLDASTKIISLKNLQTEKNQYTLGNNLGLSSDRLVDQVKMRSYTSIHTDIDINANSELSLNYVCYNMSFNIKPGVNYFTTDFTFNPIKQININDTTLARQGCFAASIPSLADKLYTAESYSRGVVSLLCTWLSGNSTNSVWIDRYYYPDRFKGVEKSAQPGTLNADIITAIDRDALLGIDVNSNNYFDIISNMVITPNTQYAYDRVDYSKFSFNGINEYNALRRNTTYYNRINKNKGLLLSFDIINYITPEQYGIYSTINDIPGGLAILFNNETLYVTLKLYSGDSKPRIIEHYVTIPTSKKTRVTVSINSHQGTLRVYLQDQLVINDTFLPAFYSNILYGEFLSTDRKRLVTLNNVFGSSTYKYNYIDDIFIATSPISDDIVNAYITYKARLSNPDVDSFYISLPCGLRNNTDNINRINSLRGSTQSKSNAFNINVSNLNIGDEHRRGIYDAVHGAVSKTLPINKAINRINIIK